MSIATLLMISCDYKTSAWSKSCAQYSLTTAFIAALSIIHRLCSTFQVPHSLCYNALLCPLNACHVAAQVWLWRFRQHESTRPSCTEARIMMELGKQYAQIGHIFLLAQVEGTANLFIWTTSNRNRRREFCMIARCFHCGKTRKGAQDPKCWQFMSHPDLLMLSGDAALLLLANVALQARQKSAANCRLRM